MKLEPSETLRFANPPIPTPDMEPIAPPKKAPTTSSPTVTISPVPPLATVPAPSPLKSYTGQLHHLNYSPPRIP